MKKLKNLTTQSGLLWASLRNIGVLTMSGIHTFEIIREIEHFLGGIRNEALKASMEEVTDTGEAFKANSLITGAIVENIRDALYVPTAPPHEVPHDAANLEAENKTLAASSGQRGEHLMELQDESISLQAKVKELESHLCEAIDTVTVMSRMVDPRAAQKIRAVIEAARNHPDVQPTDELYRALSEFDSSTCDAQVNKK